MSATGSYTEDDTIDTSAAGESGNCLFYPCKCSEFSHSSAISGTICVYRYNRTQVCQHYWLVEYGMIVVNSVLSASLLLSIISYPTRARGTIVYYSKNVVSNSFQFDVLRLFTVLQ